MSNDKLPLMYYQILSGSLTEVRFAWPDKDKEDQEMRVIGETDLHTNDVTYMSGKSEGVSWLKVFFFLITLLVSMSSCQQTPLDCIEWKTGATLCLLYPCIFMYHHMNLVVSSIRGPDMLPLARSPSTAKKARGLFDRRKTSNMKTTNKTKKHQWCCFVTKIYQIIVTICYFITIYISQIGRSVKQSKVCTTNR